MSEGYHSEVEALTRELVAIPSVVNTQGESGNIAISPGSYHPPTLG